MSKRFPKNRRAFTLIELMAVIAIILILVALAVLSVNSMGGASKLTAAGNETVDIINHARQVARSRNTLAMVVVNRTGDSAGRVLAAFVFSATNGTNGTWSQIDPWKTLPEGAKIDLAASTNFFGSPMASALPFQRAGATEECLAATFLPDGRLFSTSSQSSVIWLRNSQGSTNNFYKIIVNQATGIPIVRRP